MAAAAMAVSSPPCRARMPAASPKLNTAVSWKPPRVEDCPDEEDGESASSQSTSSPVTPATSETSFELDTDDQRDDDPLDEETTDVPPKHGTKSPNTTAQPCPNKPNSSAPLSRRSLASRHSPSKISRDDAIRDTPKHPHTDHEATQQSDATALKSHGHGPTFTLPSPPTVPRITPATLMATVLPRTYHSSVPSLTASSTSPSRRSTSPAMTSPPASPSGRPKVRFSNRGPPIIHSHGRPGIVSPRSPECLTLRAASWPNDHAVEQSWGVLFDSDGSPTPRLGRVLRSLASHLIAYFGAPGDVVITPEVMRGMYTKYSLHDDVVPYHEIFQHPRCSSISYLYFDLACPYHLVQGSPRSKPTIPGLTRDGFSVWFATNILAYPDQEYRRLNKILADIPQLRVTDSMDGEQILPSHLPHQLLPAAYDKKTRRILDMALQDTIDDSENYITVPTARHESSISPAPGRSVNYTYPSESRITRYAVTRCQSDSRASSVRPIPFDSRVRARSPPPVNRHSSSVPNISRSTPRSTHHDSYSGGRAHERDEPASLRVPHSRRRSRRSDNPTYEDYFSHSTSRHRDSDSSPDRPVTTSHGTSDRHRREKG